MSSEVRSEILNVRLPARPVLGELVEGKATLFDHQPRLVGISEQSCLDNRRILLSRAERKQQQPWRFADLHAPCAVPAAGEASAELAADVQITVHFSEPARQPR